MKITIVVPVYNVEQYIEDCLNSIAKQTYDGPIECIIVNDCTLDNSCAIINDFIDKYKGSIEFKLLHHEKNCGLSAARNTGIDAATGEYIYFLDSDDEITPDAIELLSAPLKQRRYDFVIGDYKTVGTNNEFPPLMLNEGEVIDSNKIQDFYFSRQWYMMAWNKLCNFKFIKKNNLYFKEGLINEDNLWSFQLACSANSMRVVKRITYLYKVRESSIMGTINYAKTASAFATISHEAYIWAKDKRLIYNKSVFDRILKYRNVSLTNIFLQATHKERKDLFTECRKRLRIDAWDMLKHGLLTRMSVVREMWGYLPGTLGYWYLCLYKKVRKGRL